MKKKLEKDKNKNGLILAVNGREMVDSFKFYKNSGLVRNNYTRWINNTAIYLGNKGKDYIPASNNRDKRTKKQRVKLRYYFEIDFAISLCLVVRRKESMDLRNFLIANKK